MFNSKLEYVPLGCENGAPAESAARVGRGRMSKCTEYLQKSVVASFGHYSGPLLCSNVASNHGGAPNQWVTRDPLPVTYATGVSVALNMTQNQ